MTRPGLAAAAVLAALGLSLATAMASPPEDRFAEAGELRLHSLDFGGEGLPILFVHSGDRGAQTWQEFAARFTDRHRVLAITARGVGESDGEPGDVETRGRDILAFLDALDIERSVLVGNSSPAQEMTWLAEHHPERLSGLVYLANAPWPAGIEEEDPTGALAMANSVLGEPEAYRPEYLRSEKKEIDVPALTFVAETGTRGWENFNLPMELAERVTATGGEKIEDPEARRFFQRLATDEELQDRVRSAWQEKLCPAFRANEEAFQRAFGDDLRVVPLELPFVTGYEYLNDPALIEPHIRSFLQEVTALNRASARRRR